MSQIVEEQQLLQSNSQDCYTVHANLSVKIVRPYSRTRVLKIVVCIINDPFKTIIIINGGDRANFDSEGDFL